MVIDHYCEDPFVLLPVTNMLISSRHHASAYHNEPKHADCLAGRAN